MDPSRILVFGFLSVILIGTVLLMLPQASASHKSMTFIDALFTAVSAVCVTGLIVVDTATHFSRFGQIVILFLLQIGGLGIMTMTTFFVILLGRNIGLKQKIFLKQDLKQQSLIGIKHVFYSVLIFTLVIELSGAVLLFFEFKESFPIQTAIFHSIFHSISAFCNAGFSTFSNSLENYAASLLVNIVIMILIILGGLGFVVLIELFRYKKAGRLSLHAKMVLIITIVLIIVGFFVILFVEWGNSDTLKNKSFKEKILTSLFQSVTPRTAGFNTIPIYKMRDASIFLVILLMIIGASPGGTGGGIKTTTFGLIILSVLATISGEEEIVINKIRIKKTIALKAAAITAVFIFISLLFIFILFLTENARAVDIVFEVFSAMGTVGLSLGLTSKLSVIGKIIISFAMFIGRVGPITLAVAIRFKTRSTAGVKFPEERVEVG